MTKRRILVDSSTSSIRLRKRFPFQKEDLQKSLLDRDFELPESGHRVLRLSKDGSQSQGFRWTKNETDVYYVPDISLISCEGMDLLELSQVQNDVISILDELLDTKTEVIWNEIIFNGRALGDSRPMIALGKVHNPVYETIGRILNLDVSPLGLRLYHTEEGDIDSPLNEIKNWFDISVETFVPNPAYYGIRVVYRNESTEEGMSFLRTLGERIEGVVQSIEDYHD